ncbi:MAG: mechanosensitive ion channel family protein [Anaerolineales bacterium]
MTAETSSITNLLQQLLIDFTTLLPKLIAALVVFFIGLYLATIVRRVVQKALKNRSKNPEPVTLLSQLAYWLTVILMAALSLQMIGFNLTAFLAGLGIAGFTIGFALQDVSKNFIAGLLMLIQEPFEHGETIEVGGYTGSVMGIDLRATKIRTLDGRIVLIPNGEVLTSAITNFSKAEDRRVEISTGVAYESDPDFVHQTAIEALSGIDGLLSEPIPEVLFQNFGSPTLDLTIYFWIDTSQTDVTRAKDAGLKAIKNAFDRAQIDMPLPAQTIHLVQ